MGEFWSRFFPDCRVLSIFALPLDELKKKGIRGLVFDIDNTIAPFDVAEPDEKTLAFLQDLQEQGFRVCILSNNNHRRVSRFNEKIRALAVPRAGKPGTRELRRALALLELSPEQTAIIGDQVFTDIWCGHRAGLYCILTDPVCDRDQWMTRIKRGAERWILRMYHAQN